MATAATVSLKLLIDSKGQRVLFAEADKDFVDFLFNLLLMPVGTVIRLLTKQGMVGCIGNLYWSVENLGDAYIQPTTTRDTLLKPTFSSSLATDVPLLLPNIKSSKPKGLYRCRFDHSSYYSDDPTATCPACRNVMNATATYVNPPNKVSTASSAVNEGGYVKGVVTYTILDDLTVSPMSTISSITMLNKFNVKQVDALQEKVENVGMNEGVELLKASLQSKTVLTDVFLAQKAGKKPPM